MAEYLFFVTDRPQEVRIFRDPRQVPTPAVDRAVASREA